ncbi:class II aldolase/adducin family protein [Patescibacteria group bacterium]
MKKIITIVGGPVPQKLDPVLNIVPTGNGKLADSIATELESDFIIERVGNFPKGFPMNFEELEKLVQSLKSDVTIFMPHLPNFLVDYQEDKISVENGDSGEIKIHPAPKLVRQIKRRNPETLLIPFKIAREKMSKVEIVRWMLDLRAAIAVYSRIGESKKFFIIDALGNETPVSKEKLPFELQKKLEHYLKAVRRRTIHKKVLTPKVKHLEKLVTFSKKMQPAFSQLIEKNVSSGRWPGNMSLRDHKPFRCTHGFISTKASDGFLITRRNVKKTGLREQDFVFVSLELENGKIPFYGSKNSKPSIDAPVHRVIYEQLPWVNSIIHGHLHISGDVVHKDLLQHWPCGAENEGYDIVKVAPTFHQKLWIANVKGHGFVALIGDKDPAAALDKLSRLDYSF